MRRIVGFEISGKTRHGKNMSRPSGLTSVKTYTPESVNVLIQRLSNRPVWNNALLVHTIAARANANQLRRLLNIRHSSVLERAWVKHILQQGNINTIANTLRRYGSTLQMNHRGILERVLVTKLLQSKNALKIKNVIESYTFSNNNTAALMNAWAIYSISKNNRKRLANHLVKHHPQTPQIKETIRSLTYTNRK
jgi:hypothetical protein